MKYQISIDTILFLVCVPDPFAERGAALTRYLPRPKKVLQKNLISGEEEEVLIAQSASPLSSRCASCPLPPPALYTEFRIGIACDQVELIG
jgi:hypothetical protein